MKKILFLVTLLMLFASAGVSAEITATAYLNLDTAECKTTGSWTKGSQGGYKNELVMKTNGGSAEWVDKTSRGNARVSYWVALDEAGASDAEIYIRTEYGTRTKKISFSEGVSGWVDIGYFSVTGGGIVVKVNGGSDGESYLSSVRIEYLSDEYDSMEKFSRANPEHILLGKFSAVAFDDGARINMKTFPKIDDDEAYVSSEAMLRFFGAYVNSDGANVSFDINGMSFSGAIGAESFTAGGNTVSGAIAVQCDDEVKINVTAVSRALGKNVFVSNKGLVVISDTGIDFDEKTDKQQILNLLSILRIEEA